jgi:hypothetical protein
MTKSKLGGYAVKFGAKYGPHILLAAMVLKVPATAYAQRTLASRRARRLALKEAATLADGSVLRVFHDGAPVWVVYSGEAPVSRSPEVPVPLATLVEHADLTQRVRPTDPARAAVRHRRA